MTANLEAVYRVRETTLDVPPTRFIRIHPEEATDGTDRKNRWALVGRRVFKRGEELEMVSTERHYSVPEVAKMWKLSDEKIRELFRDEPGVLKLDCPETLRKRGYCTLRIPQSVLDRVHQRLHGKAA